MVDQAEHSQQAIRRCSPSKKQWTKPSTLNRRYDVAPLPRSSGLSRALSTGDTTSRPVHNFHLRNWRVRLALRQSTRRLVHILFQVTKSFGTQGCGEKKWWKTSETAQKLLAVGIGGSVRSLVGPTLSTLVKKLYYKREISYRQA